MRWPPSAVSSTEASCAAAERNMLGRGRARQVAAEDHGGDTYPFVFESAGVPAVWEPAYNAVAKTGKLVVIGFNDQPAGSPPCQPAL
jgi:threonine dehydrogenase-like Zn-dependent dehydrogenase